MDLLYGYSLFRLITRQIDDDEIVDRVSATIAEMARSGIPKPLGAQSSTKDNAMLERTNHQSRCLSPFDALTLAQGRPLTSHHGSAA